MITKIKQHISSIIKDPILGVFLLLFISETIAKILFNTGYKEFHISQWLKIIAQLIFVWVILKNNTKTLLPILLLFGLFCLGQLYLVSLDQFLKTVIFFDKYIYIFLALLYVSFQKKREDYTTNIELIFNGIIWVNSVVIIVAFLLDLSIFKTYYYGSRLGYNGFILRSGATSYIYWFALLYLAHEIFVNKNKKKIVLFLITVIASFLLGTKSMLIAFVFVALYLFFANNFHKKNLAIILLIPFVIGFVIYFDNITSYLLNFSPNLFRVYEKYGFWASITSLRNLHFYNEMLPSIQGHWSLKNYLFGGALDMHYRSQFGLLDLFYMFGIIGSVLYLYLFKIWFINFKLNLLSIFFILGTFVIMSFSSHFFYETILPFYLLFMHNYFIKNQNSF